MFDITGPDGTAYKESATVKPGGDIVLYELEGLTVGCTLCYDLRFAELFISLAKRGAAVIVLPASFTLQTGKDHWEVLCRARAIETQAYFVARGQWGDFQGPDGARSEEPREGKECVSTGRPRWAAENEKKNTTTK